MFPSFPAVYSLMEVNQGEEDVIHLFYSILKNYSFLTLEGLNDK